MEELVTEKRKHDPSQYKNIEDVIAEMKERPDSEDIYVHFSNTFTDSKDQLISQVGINTQQDYGNPFGIYAYPINNITGTFKTDAQYAYFLKNKKVNRYIDHIDDMGVEESQRCLEIIKNKFFRDSLRITDTEFDNFLKQTESLAKNKSVGGVLFYLIVRMSEKKEYAKGVRPALFQTKIWQDLLGYTFLGDKNGTGIIHSSEKHQAVWFSSKYYDVLDVATKTAKRELGNDFYMNVGKIIQLPVKEYYKQIKHAMEYKKDIHVDMIIQKILASFYKNSQIKYSEGDGPLNRLHATIKASLETDTFIDFSSDIFDGMEINNPKDLTDIIDAFLPLLKTYSRTYFGSIIRSALENVDVTENELIIGKYMDMLRDTGFPFATVVDNIAIMMIMDADISDEFIQMVIDISREDQIERFLLRYRDDIFFKDNPALKDVVVGVLHKFRSEKLYNSLYTKFRENIVFDVEKITPKTMYVLRNSPDECKTNFNSIFFDDSNFGKLIEKLKTNENYKVEYFFDDLVDATYVSGQSVDYLRTLVDEMKKADVPIQPSILNKLRTLNDSVQNYLNNFL